MIAWLDIETTGLEPRRDLILEVGIVITDDNLSRLADTSVVVGWTIQRDGTGLVNDLLDRNGGFTRKMHTENGLIDEVHASSHDQWSAEAALIDFMHASNGFELPVMGGASIAFDRGFLAQQMPKLLEMFHYRSIDVSGVRELARRWRPDCNEFEPQVGKGHRVISDINDSIGLAEFYREFIFNNPSNPTPGVSK